MKQLIGAFESFFSAAAQSGGELAETARFTLENVNWDETLNSLEAASHPIAETYLESTCAQSGQPGSSTRHLGDALMAEPGCLKWRTRSSNPEDGPEIMAFTENYSATTVIGNGGLLPSDKVSAGFSLQGRNAYYPPHGHTAEESYWIIGGGGEWKVDEDPWFAVESGDAVYHKSGALHAMRTSVNSMLSVWVWTSHLDSKVVIVRGAT